MVCLQPPLRHGSVRKGEVWWFPAWSLGVLRPYLMAIALSLAAALAPALWTGAWSNRALRWSLVFAELLALTMVTIVITHYVSRHRDTALPGAEGTKSE